MSRNRLATLAVLCTSALMSPSLFAQEECFYPLFHGFDSYFVCSDRDSFGAFAYQLSDPANVNTGTADILCEALDRTTCFSPASGIAGDGLMTIETTWGGPGSVGCPIVSGVASRLALITASGHESGGESILVSLAGSNHDFFYLIEAAHTYDPATEAIFPVSSASSVRVRDRQPGAITLGFSPITLHTDCDPGTVGDLLHICASPYLPTLATGPLYTKVQPCGGQVDLRTAVWTPTGVTPDATGRATVFVEAPPAGDCRLLGATIVIDGVESPAVAAYVAGADCVNRDGDPSWTCSRDCDALECAADCDDNDPTTYPGGPNGCPSDPCPRDIEDPGWVDSDGDFVPDPCDNCPYVPNSNQSDIDNDGVGDACDNCPADANPGQENADGDPFGDVCDNCPDIPNNGLDSDLDGWGDICDNCPDVANADQHDLEFDGVGDVCDNCFDVPNHDQDDTDADIFGDACDNCPTVANVDQADCDQDHVGDVCEACSIPPPGAPDPCGCRPQEAVDITVSAGSELGKGSGVLHWRSTAERDLLGFNVVVFSPQGQRSVVNHGIVPCQQCIDGLGADYYFIVPKHKSGRVFFVEVVHMNGLINTFGPSTRD